MDWEEEEEGRRRLMERRVWDVRGREMVAAMAIPECRSSTLP